MIAVWVGSHGLMLNTKKTKSMVISLLLPLLWSSTVPPLRKSLLFATYHQRPHLVSQQTCNKAKRLIGFLFTWADRSCLSYLYGL